MDSAASITDFDSDDDDYLYHNSGNNNHSDNSSNSSSNSVKSQSCPVHKFGEFEDNYGWIQCRSKSYPDRVYYHNTRSGCNTWYRPISRYIDIPFVTIRRANHTNDSLESGSDLELMSVSDNEKDPNVSGGISTCDHNRSLIDVSDVVTRYYYTPQMVSNTDDSHSSTDEYASECFEMKEEQADVNDENSDVNDSKAVCSQLLATNFLETELFVRDDVDTKETSRIFNSLLKENASNVRPYRTKRIVYRVPRLKKIGPESQLIKPSRTWNRKAPSPGPRKIISDMYGVRTISYDLPEPDQPCAAVGVKTTTLSDSDSDVSVPPSPLHTKTTLSFEFDIAKDLRQPLLSDPSSSPSSRSDTTSSSTNRSSSSSSCSCTSCSREA